MLGELKIRLNQALDEGEPELGNFLVGLDIPDYVTSNNEEPRIQITEIIKRLVEESCLKHPSKKVYN